jgi:hypothetical protein
MAVKPNKPSILKVSGMPHAPIVFFDEAPVSSNYNGIIGITLCTNITSPDGTGGLTNDMAAVAFLRCNIQAARALRNALDRALLLGAKTEGQAN